MHITDQGKQKMNSFQEAGNDRLLVLTDFDRTLTPHYTRDNQLMSTSWSRFRDAGLLGEDYKKRSTEMYEYYYPIEIDPHVEEDFRDEQLGQWWKAHLELLIEVGVTEKLFREAVQEGVPMLRDGCRKFIRDLEDRNIPLCICSSGLGNFIQMFLAKENLLKEEIVLYTNLLTFEDGVASGYEDPVFHVYSKSHVWDRIDQHPLMRDKTHVLVMGDTLGDLTMTDDDGSHEFLTIGFCNEPGDKHREVFEANFDIVLHHDAGFEEVNKVWSNIID